MEALATLQTLYPTFTKTEAKIADYILAEPDSHIFLNYTLEYLSQTIGVGQASILRLVKKCGYPNFRAFLVGLQQSRFKSATATRLAKRQEGGSLLNDVVDRLRSCSENLSSESLRLAAECMRKADFVVCTGLGNSAHVASLVSARLRREGLVAISIVPGEIDLAGTFMARSVRAVVLVFSVSGETEETIKIANRYVRNGSCVVAITSHVESTLSKLSNITFYAPSNFNQKGHSRDLEGMITPLFVAEALVEEYEAQLSQNEEETQL